METNEHTNPSIPTDDQILRLGLSPSLRMTCGGKPSPFLLHACCGPCSLEPVRILCERGIEPAIFFSNSNIAPAEEYEKRRDTIKNWCEKNDVTFIEDNYAPEEWEEAVKGCKANKPERCRQCYRLRFERAAKFAKENGFQGVGTTLTISPYQYALTIKEELQKACENAGLKCFYEDYSPHFREAQRRAKEEGLYRQHYCGCLPSKAEAESEKKRMAAMKEKRAQARENELQKKRDEKQAYAEKRAKQKAILKNMRKETHVN